MTCYHVCSCYDFVTWPDGSRHRCTCSGRGATAYVIEGHCTGHPPIIGSCERHGERWREEGQECWLCREDAERRASPMDEKIKTLILTGDLAAYATFAPPKEES